MSPRVHQLPSGLRLVCDPVAGFETLAVSLMVGRGARVETEAQSGWAHLLEHMVFKAAGERSAREIVEVIEAEGGNINAATGYERTSFQVRALKGGLPLALEVLSDLVLRPALRADDLAREKPVIAQEIAEAADTPDDVVFDFAQAEAFAGQSLGRPILGARKTLRGATGAKLEAFRAQLYAPEAMVVSVAGAVDEDELLAQVEALFGDATPSPAAHEAAEPAAFTGGAALNARRLEQAHLVFLLPTAGLRDPDYFAVRLFVEILGGGMASRLFQAVRERLGLAYAVDAYADVYADTGVVGVYAGCSAQTAGEAARVIAEQVRELADGVTEPELARAKAQLKAGTFMAAESAVARAELSAGQLFTYGRLLSTAELGAAIDAVTREDLMRVGAGLLQRKAHVCSILGPRRAMAAAESFEQALFG